MALLILLKKWGENLTLPASAFGRLKQRPWTKFAPRLLLKNCGTIDIIISPTYAQSPTVSIISPAPGEVVYGDSITANVRMPDNFILGQDGYLYFWLDATLERDSSNAVIVPEAKHTFAQVTS